MQIKHDTKNDTTSGDRKVRILVVGDKPAQLDSSRRRLVACGYDCVGVTSTTESMEVLCGLTNKPQEFDVLVVDGITSCYSELASIVRAFKGTLPIIVFTSHAATRETEELEKSGIPIIKKPFNPEQLDRDIRALLANTKDSRQGPAT